MLLSVEEATDIEMLQGSERGTKKEGYAGRTLRYLT